MNPLVAQFITQVVNFKKRFIVDGHHQIPDQLNRIEKTAPAIINKKQIAQHTTPGGLLIRHLSPYIPPGIPESNQPQ